jgi:hypothetical protein
MGTDMSATTTIEKQRGEIEALCKALEAALIEIEKLRAESTRKSLGITEAEANILRKSEARRLAPGLDSPGVLPGTSRMRTLLFTGDVKDRIAKDRKHTS